MFINSPVTTVLGILTILAGVINALIEYLSKKPINFAVLAAAFTTGAGLMNAKDGNVTGGTKPYVAEPAAKEPTITVAPSPDVAPVAVIALDPPVELKDLGIKP